MKTFLLALLALSSLALPGVAQQVPSDVAAKDFAFGVALTPDKRAAIHGYTLPESVLRTLTDVELSDLCVFDAKGNQRPLALHTPRDVAGEQLEVPLPFFPLQAAAPDAAEGVEVQVERDPLGNILRAFSKSVAVQDTRLSALLDTSAISDPIIALNLALTGPRDFTIQVEVESSEDLAGFEPLTHATLVHLEHGGHKLSRDVVELPSARARYLRLTIKRPAGASDLVLDSVQARVEKPSSAPTRQFVELTPQDTSTRDKQLFTYQLPGVFKVDRYGVRLPAGTPLAEVTLLSSSDLNAAFRVLDRALFQQTGSERELTRTDDDFYELCVSEKGGGIRGGVPKLRLGYLAPQLLFASSDAEPYLLAYGSATARCKRFDEDELLSIASAPAGSIASTDSVQPGKLQTIAGKSALEPAAAPRPLRLYILWAVLLLGVGVLAAVTRKLLHTA